MAISEEIKAEARAFDDRIDERVHHGHLPDLRRVQACDWFFNNPWRRPYLVDMDCGRAFRFALAYARKGRLLEVGCGPGHMSLEFARNGFHVVGLDVSARCLKIAEELRDSNPFQEAFGSLHYVHDDFLSWESPKGSFDTVCFFGSLHHQREMDRVLKKVAQLLRPGGRLLVLEPARDWIAESNGAVVALIRLLLSFQNLWYEQVPSPGSKEELEDYAADCLGELRSGHDKGEADQSPHDNASLAEQMLTSLRARFQELECLRINGFLQRVVGGVRGVSEAQTKNIAEFLDVFDKFAIEIGLIKPGEFYWAGQQV